MSKWTKQPPASARIDWSNPLTRGLVSAFNFQPGPIVDLVTGKRLDVYTHTTGTAAPNDGGATIDAPIYKTCRGGMGIDMQPRSGPTYTWLRNTTGIFDLTDFPEYSRLIGIADFDSSGSGNPGLWRSADNSLGNDFDIYGAADDGWWLYVNGLTKHQSNNTDVIALGPYENHSISYGLDGDTHAYIDGRLKASDANGYTAFTTNTVYNLGCQHVVNKYLGGTWTHLYIWNRELTEGEHKALGENPWQIFKPPLNFALADPLPQTRVLAPRVRKWATRPPLGTPVRRGLGIRTLFVPDRATNSALEWFTNIRVAAPSGMIVQADDRYGVVMRNVDGAGTGFYILYAGQIEYFDDGWTDQVQISSIFRKDVHEGLGGNILLAQGGNDDDFCTEFGILSNELIVGNISSGASNPSNTLQASPNDLSLWHGIFASRVNGVGQKLRTHNVFDDPIDTTVTGPPNQFGATQPLTLGGGSDDLYFPLVVISDREWSDAECVAFYNDPWNFVFEAPKLHVPIEYQELTFDEDAEERLFMIPQRARRQPK